MKYAILPIDFEYDDDTYNSEGVNYFLAKPLVFADKETAFAEHRRMTLERVEHDRLRDYVTHLQLTELDNELDNVDVYTQINLSTLTEQEKATLYRVIKDTFYYIEEVPDEERFVHESQCYNGYVSRASYKVEGDRLVLHSLTGPAINERGESFYYYVNGKAVSSHEFKSITREYKIAKVL